MIGALIQQPQGTRFSREFHRMLQSMGYEKLNKYLRKVQGHIPGGQFARKVLRGWTRSRIAYRWGTLRYHLHGKGFVFVPRRERRRRSKFNAAYLKMRAAIHGANAHLIADREANDRKRDRRRRLWHWFTRLWRRWSV